MSKLMPKNASSRNEAQPPAPKTLDVYGFVPAAVYRRKKAPPPPFSEDEILQWADAFRVFAFLPLKGWFTGHMMPNVPALHISSEYAEAGGVNWGETFLSDRQQIARLRGEGPNRLIPASCADIFWGMGCPPPA